MDYRTVEKILKNNGFDRIKKNSSDHVKFYNNKGKHVSIPKKRNVNNMLWRRLVKENNLEVQRRKI